MGESRAEAEPAEDSMFAEAAAVLEEDCGRIMAVGAVGAVGDRWGDSGVERTVLGGIEGGCGVDGSSEVSMGREREAADWSRSASPRQRPRFECGQLNRKLRQGQKATAFDGGDGWLLALVDGEAIRHDVVDAGGLGCVGVGGKWRHGRRTTELRSKQATNCWKTMRPCRRSKGRMGR
jgi:hypothetical protein